MICAEDELGLGNSHDGIMVLDKDAKPGTPAASAILKLKRILFLKLDLLLTGLTADLILELQGIWLHTLI